MWKTLLIFLLLIWTVWWFSFREKTVDIMTQDMQGNLVLENLSDLEYKKNIRSAMGRNIALPEKTLVEEKNTTSEPSSPTSIPIYKIDTNGNLVEDVATVKELWDSWNTETELLVFAGSFPTALEWDFALQVPWVSQNIAGIDVPDFSRQGTTSSSNGWLIFDPPFVLGDPQPATGGMRFGTWRGNM